MGRKQDRLTQLFHSTGLKVSTNGLSVPTAITARTSPYAEAIFDVYKQLGGVQHEFPLRLGAWDIVVDGIAVELDEQLHFNRYRARTLQSRMYENLPNFPLQAYKTYCQQRESECLRAGSYGGKWTNPSCERQFGPSAPDGNLSGNGAPRWKQRAFYDFVKDLSPLLLGIRMVRISIWETLQVNGQSIYVKDVLARSDLAARDAVHELFASRM